MRRTSIHKLATTLLLFSSFVIAGSCREQPPYEEAALQRNGSTVIVECGVLPMPPRARAVTSHPAPAAVSMCCCVAPCCRPIACCAAASF